MLLKLLTILCVYIVNYESATVLIKESYYYYYYCYMCECMVCRSRHQMHTFVASPERTSWVREVLLWRSVVVSNSGVWRGLSRWDGRTTTSVLGTAAGTRVAAAAAGRRCLQVRRVIEPAVVNVKAPRSRHPTWFLRLLTHTQIQHISKTSTFSPFEKLCQN